MSGTVLITTSSFGVFDARPLEMIKAAGLVPVLNPHGRKLVPDETKALFQAHLPVGIVAGTEKLSGELIESAVNLKTISRMGTGWDNVDHNAAKQRGILVYRTPDSHVEAVGELAMGHILSLLRHIALADRNIRNNKWKPLMGGLLKGKTIGLVGFGKVGRHVANAAVRGFGANAIGYDPYIPPAEWDGTLCRRIETLDALLNEADIVSLHLPGDGKGPIIGAKEISLMKRGAIIINTARGGLIDEAALKEAIDSGILGGAGLDVYGEEPYKGSLLSSDRVVMTMHMGSYAKETRIRMEIEAIENLLMGLREKGVIK